MSNLGGGVQGSRPGAGFANTAFSADDAMKRKILRKSFGKSSLIRSSDQQVIRSFAGPFRASMNQGDFLNRVGQSCGGSSQSRSNGISHKDCATITLGVSTAEMPLYYGNRVYVSDSSLYTRFKNLDSTLKTYNDLSFGGDASNGSYSFLRKVRS
jgi:hypothetical protein